MKIVALFACLFGTAFAIPLIPQRLVSASASNELLLGMSLGLGAGGLLPLQTQGGALNPLIPQLPGILQQQSQNPGLPQFPFPARVPLVARLTNQNGFPGQMAFPGQGQFPLAAQGTQLGQQDPMQPHMPQQNQQQPNQMMPYFFSNGMPQTQGQNLPYFAYYPQTGQFVLPGGQQQPMPNEPLTGGAPATHNMPAGNVEPQFAGEMMNFGNANPGGLMLMPSHTPTTPDALTSTTDATIDPSLIDDKTNINLINEP
ncbi:odontogenic ameloblast-associated protein isoform X2 [Rhinatrema bivittatum]|uniref:odontogenic ameloblast-associated protein isoform X2 n=1 Tax=Rhinatrema bivittatum TaxID=194408 RepID=UPI0011271AF2|nr:odontogenic ameloblast-associated protein isoform X2 [Rhinatrema bivittatum]